MEKESMTIVVFSGEMDKALAAFTLANTAAAMGIDVTMFFTFWGLGIIKKGSLSRGSKSMLQWLMSIMRRGGAENLKLSQMNMAGIGKKAMKILMKKYNMPSILEAMALAKEQGVRFVACTTSMALMGLTEDDFTETVDEFAGAATYLGEASKSKINLFI